MDCKETVSRIATAIAFADDFGNETTMAFAQAWTCGEELAKSPSLEKSIADCPYVPRYSGWQEGLAAIGAARLSRVLEQVITIMSGQNSLPSPQEVQANIQRPENRQRLQTLRDEFRNLAAGGCPEDLDALLYRYANEHPDEFRKFK